MFSTRKLALCYNTTYRVARVAEHKATTPVRVLGLALFQAMLAHQCRLLVSKDLEKFSFQCVPRFARSTETHPRDRYTPQRPHRNLSIDFGTTSDLGQEIHGDFEIAAEGRVPLEGLDVHEHCSRSVGHVCDVQAVVLASCQVLRERLQLISA